MYATQNTLNLSLSLGHCRGVNVRLSLLAFVAMAALMWRLGSVPSGLLATAVLLLSVLLHQLAQVFVAQATDSELSDIVIWPLGGLTTQARDAGFLTQVQVHMAGPVVNLAVVMICYFQLQQIKVDPALLNPLTDVQLQLGESLARALVTMIYFANVLLLCVNLLPVVPFDAGRLLRSFLSERYDTVEVNDVMVRLGLVISLLGLVGGFIFDQSTVVALSSFVLIIHLHEIGLRSAYFRTDSHEHWPDESADLDPELEDLQFYRSNSEDTDTDDLIARSSMMARRIARKESEQQRHEAAAWQKEEQLVDEILQRIHRDGEDSLKPAELQLLRKVSNRYQRRPEPRDRNTETDR